MPSLQLRDIAQAFLKRPGVILLVMLGFVGPTLGVSLWQTPLYEASAKLVVGQKPPGDTPDYYLLPEIEPLQRILPAVVDAIDSPPLAEEVIQRLGLRMEPAELLENLSVEQEGSTVFIQLSYKDADPERAQQIVNTVGVVSSERIPERIGSAYYVTVTMWERASVPSTPASPKPLRNAALALILGLAAKDVVLCGDGFDRVLADREDLVAPDCEKVFVGLGSLEEWHESIPQSFWEGLPQL